MSDTHTDHSDKSQSSNEHDHAEGGFFSERTELAFAILSAVSLAVGWLIETGGAPHPAIARDLNDLGVALQSAGRLEEARDHYQRALAMDEALLGPAHPNLARDLANLSEAQRSLGEYPAALQSARRALEIFEPTIFLFDAYPGGIGFSELLYDSHDGLLKAAEDLIRACPCKHGCPSCVGPTLEVGPTAKDVALMILGLLRGQRV